VPWPASIRAENQYFKLSNKTTILLLSNPFTNDAASTSRRAFELGQVVGQEINVLTRGELQLMVTNMTTSGSNDKISLGLDSSRFGEA